MLNRRGRRPLLLRRRLPATCTPSLLPADLPPAFHPLPHPSPSGPAACPQATRPLPDPQPPTWVPGVTSDKLLSTIIIKRPQLWESNPDAPRAASPQGQPPGRLQFLGFESESDLTLENLRKSDEPSLPTTMPPALEVPVNPTNQRAGLATDPRITQATAE
ncbi:hypothetical protein DSO57_1009155 [Entomophthora muscae]|uniref:Uncharacterized protein n=1 Tax=Entomophthora muscae TaxID=34485 RepID=A0ACC2SJT4_9FUNG|nr:hypothetical protein DSO57_1009155 [Entomophthora muscae]